MYYFGDATPHHTGMTTYEVKQPVITLSGVKAGTRNNQFGQIHCIPIGERYNTMI